MRRKMKEIKKLIKVWNTSNSVEQAATRLGLSNRQVSIRAFRLRTRGIYMKKMPKLPVSPFSWNELADYSTQFKKEEKIKSSYRGVYWHKTNKKWKAMITANGKTYYLGYYSDERAAAEAYDAAARLHLKESARPNFSSENHASEWDTLLDNTPVEGNA